MRSLRLGREHLAVGGLWLGPDARQVKHHVAGLIDAHHLDPDERNRDARGELRKPLEPVAVGVPELDRLKPADHLAPDGALRLDMAIRQRRFDPRIRRAPRRAPPAFRPGFPRRPPPPPWPAAGAPPRTHQPRRRERSAPPPPSRSTGCTAP